MSRAVSLENRTEGVAADVHECVIAHDGLGRPTALVAEPLDRTREHRARDLGAVVAVHLDIGQAAVVIDHAVGVLDADSAVAMLLGAIAVSPVARTLKARQLLGSM